jgi:hypothetical protein
MASMQITMMVTDSRTLSGKEWWLVTTIITWSALEHHSSPA